MLTLVSWCPLTFSLECPEGEGSCTGGGAALAAPRRQWESLECRQRAPPPLIAIILSCTSKTNYKSFLVCPISPPLRAPKRFLAFPCHYPFPLLSNHSSRWPDAFHFSTPSANNFISLGSLLNPSQSLGVYAKALLTGSSKKRPAAQAGPTRICRLQRISHILPQVSAHSLHGVLEPLHQDN